VRLLTRDVDCSVRVVGSVCSPNCCSRTIVMLASTVRRAGPSVSNVVIRRAVIVAPTLARGLTTSRTGPSGSSANRSWFGFGAAAVASVAAYAYTTQSEVAAAAGETGLDPKAFVPFKLAKVSHATTTTRLRGLMPTRFSCPPLN
jgi:hypothetical protein